MIKVDIRRHLYMRGGAVGIGSRYDSDLEVEIHTKDKEGVRLFPNIYSLKRDTLLSHPVETFSSGIPVRVVPITELEINEVNQEVD